MEKLQELILDSREVAKMLPKRHCDLMRDIETYSNYLLGTIERNFALNEFWKESTYKDSIGRTLKCYQITKKGCEFLAHKMTGKKGALFTAAYINRFHEMEQQLQEGGQTVTLSCSMWRGQKVMTSRDCEVLIGIRQQSLTNWLRRYKLPYTILEGELLTQYRVENSVSGAGRGVWRLLVMSLETAYALAKYYTANKATVVEQLNQYFGKVKDLVPVVKENDEVVSIRTENVMKQVACIKDKLTALSVMSTELIGCKRSKESHEKYVQFLYELGMSVTGDLYNLKQKIIGQ